MNDSEPGGQTLPGPQAAVPQKAPETTTEKYLRHIKNILMTALLIWLIGGLVGGIIWLAVAAHENAEAQNASCSAQGGTMVNGQCY